MSKQRGWWVALALVALVALGGASAWQLGLGGQFGRKAFGAEGAASAGGAAGAAKGTAGNAQHSDGKASEPPLEFIASELTQPRLSPLPTAVEFSGPLVAPQTAVLRAKAVGTLAQLLVAEGARVKRGQVLARLDLAEAASRVNERDAATMAAQAALAQARRTHANNEQLAAQSFISGTALDSSKAALETAQANLKAAQASAQTTRVSLQEAQVVAPFAGIVARRHALAGERVSPEQVLLTLISLTPLELAGLVGTHEVSALAVGQAVVVQVEGQSQSTTAKLSRIAPAAETGTRAIGVVVELPNADERYKAGQYALATVRIDDNTPRLTLPIAAVAEASGQHHVWLLQDGALTRRAVTLGRRSEVAGLVHVLQGVDANSTVLAARYDNLREGAKAKLVAARAAAAPASAALAAPSATSTTAAPSATPTSAASAASGAGR